jgi:hypothetical protein
LSRRFELRRRKGVRNRFGKNSFSVPDTFSYPLRGHSRRRDPALLNPLAYEQLDKRQLLASGDDTSGDPPNLLLDLPPVASSTLQQLLSSSGGFSSGLWRSASDQLNYNAGNWAAQLTPQQFDSRDWSGYTINTSVPSGFSVSNLKSIVPLEENNGYLVLVRQRTTGRTLSGGGPAGGGLEGGGGGMGGGSEQVDSLVLSSIFHVRTQAEADAINPLTYNPADFPSRMVVTSNTQFNFRDTTIAGQVRSVAVALTYQRRKGVRNRFGQISFSVPDTFSCLSRVAQPVYNLEVHGEHVYQVGELGVLVHNACSGFHHFAPRAWGSDVPYGPKYLSWLDELQHTSVHRGFSDFLKLRTGHFFNSISGNQWQNILDYRTRRALLIEFHQTFAGGAHWNDFVQEVLKARKAGYNPWGR